MAAEWDASELTPLDARVALLGMEQSHFGMNRCSSPSVGHVQLERRTSSGVPASAFQTPMSSCGNGEMLTGAPELVSAQLLPSAQQKLQEAYPGSVPPQSLLACPALSEKQCQIEVLFPKMNSLDATMDICDFSRKTEQHEDTPETNAKDSDQHEVHEEIGDSDEESVTSMNSRHARKRKRDQMQRCNVCDQRTRGAAAMQQHYRSLCDGLAAQNAVLKSQLAAAVKALSCERASSQAELYALRQKNAALGAFLPQSVAAFASEVPSNMYTKKGVQALLR